MLPTSKCVLKTTKKSVDKKETAYAQLKTVVILCNVWKMQLFFCMVQVKPALEEQYSRTRRRFTPILLFMNVFHEKKGETHCLFHFVSLNSWVHFI